MTKNQKTYLILGIGGAGLAWWWWRRSQGLALIPNPAGSGGAGFAGSEPNPPSVGGSVPIDDPQIVMQRNAQTGALARKSCLFPNRWINTTTGPYFGKCVQQDVFDRWIALPGDIQRYATDATYAQFMTSIGR